MMFTKPLRDPLLLAAQGVGVMPAMQTLAKHISKPDVGNYVVGALREPI
jgi:hypothetical protein